MSYVYVLEKIYTPQPDEKLPFTSCFIASAVIFETKEQASEKAKQAAIFFGAHKVNVIELYLPREKYLEFMGNKDTHMLKEHRDQFLAANDAACEYNIRNVANTLAQGMRDRSSPVSKLDFTLAAMITTFFHPGNPMLEKQVQNHIEVKSLKK